MSMGISTFIRKSIAWALVAGIVGFAAWAMATYPRIGGVVLTAATRSEAALHGLHRRVVDIADSHLMTWQGGPHDASETVVMIHGYSADKTVWLRFAPPFTAHYRVLVIDLPGHGETPFDPALKYDTLSQATRVLQAMDALNIGRAHIVGNSMGGYIAAQLALHHPERVQSATLIDAAGITPPEPSDMDKMLAAGHNPFQVRTRADFDAFYAMTMAKPPWVPHVVLDYVAADYMARRETLARIFQDFRGVDPLDGHLGEIHVPVLVLWGDQDRLINHSAASVWAQGIAGAELIRYADLGHMPMAEDPARSARDVLAFIGRHP